MLRPALFALLVTYYFLFPHAGFTGVVPDNIAQTAYFNLLSRPHLVGSIGSSSPKAGLIFLLGISHHLSYEVIQSAWPFKILISFLFSVTLFLINRTAAALGGEIAGAAALLVSAASGYLTLTYFTVSSNLFFLPPVLAGLFLLCKNRERAAVVLLSVSATVRPESLIIIALMIAIRTLPARRWRRSMEYSAYGAAALVVYVLVAYRVQGSWDRIGAGSGTGYPAFASLMTTEHVRSTVGQFFRDRFVALLCLPALYALVRLPASRPLGYFFSMGVVFLGLAAAGILAFHYRYIASAQAVVFTLGCAGISLCSQQFSKPRTRELKREHLLFSVGSALLLAMVYWSARDFPTLLTMLVIPTIFLLAALIHHSGGTWLRVIHGRSLAFALLAGLAILSIIHLRQELGKLTAIPHPAIQDARDFLSEPLVGPGSSILADDEMLNYLIVKRPDYFRNARSLQSFNILPDGDRRHVLKGTEFLYVSKRRNYGWNYLYYLPRAEWRYDAFRQAVHKMIESNQSQRILGVTLQPVYNSPSRLIARIRPYENNASLQIRKKTAGGNR